MGWVREKWGMGWGEVWPAMAGKMEQKIIGGQLTLLSLKPRLLGQCPCKLQLSWLVRGFMSATGVS